MEVGGVRDVEADGQQGTLIGKDQILIGPGVGGHLPKHQLPLRQLQPRLQSKTLQGAFDLLGTPAAIMHPLHIHRQKATKECLYASMCKSSQARSAVQEALAETKISIVVSALQV